MAANLETQIEDLKSNQDRILKILGDIVAQLTIVVTVLDQLTEETS